MTADPVPTSMVAILIAAVVALAGVVAYLFRYYSRRTEEMQKERLASELAYAKEREDWASERSRLSTALDIARGDLRAEYEAKHRTITEDYAHTVRAMLEAAREHEATARREFAANVETVSDRLVEASAQVASVLDKYYDRLTTKTRKS